MNKSIKCAIVGVGSQMLRPIESIVPIADVTPEIISEYSIEKQKVFELDDAIRKESYRQQHLEESQAWKIKKDKKDNHKRKNKRK